MLPASLCAKIMVFRRITRIIEVVLNERAVLAGELKDFSLDELSSKIMQLREENKAENFAVSLKIPSDASEGVVYDLKQVLRKGYMLKLNLTNDF